MAKGKRKASPPPSERRATPSPTPSPPLCPPQRREWLGCPDYIKEGINGLEEVTKAWMKTSAKDPSQKMARDLLDEHLGALCCIWSGQHCPEDYQSASPSDSLHTLPLPCEKAFAFGESLKERDAAENRPSSSLARIEQRFMPILLHLVEKIYNVADSSERHSTHTLEISQKVSLGSVMQREMFRMLREMSKASTPPVPAPPKKKKKKKAMTGPPPTPTFEAQKERNRQAVKRAREEFDLCGNERAKKKRSTANKATPSWRIGELETTQSTPDF